MDKSPYVSHKLHIFLTLITIGMWLPVYVIYYLFRRLTGPKVDVLSPGGQGNYSPNQELPDLTAIDAPPTSTVGSRQPDLGYKKGGKHGNAFMLECNHQILASGVIYSGVALIGREVYCEVCRETRRVTAAQPRS